MNNCILLAQRCHSISPLLPECLTYIYGNAQRRQVCVAMHSDNINPGAAWRANHSSGRNFGIGWAFFALFFHLSSVTYWRASNSRDTQRKNNVRNTRFEFLETLKSHMVLWHALRDTDVLGRPAASIFRHLHSTANKEAAGSSKTLMHANQFRVVNPTIPRS